MSESGRGLSRRGLLAAAVLAVAGGGVAGTGAVRHLRGDSAEAAGRAPTPDRLAAVRSRVTAYVAEVGNGNLSVAVRDRTSGVALTVGTGRFQTASIVKVDILAALLWQARQRGQEITDDDRSDAKKMITASDNVAATALYRRIGGKSGLTTANKAFGMTETRPEAGWGITTTTAADQIRLLTSLTDENGPLDSDGRSYLFDLMSQVEADQAWGVSAAGLASTRVYLKNGWDTFGVVGDRWQVNTIGRLVEPGHDWLVAVLSNHDKTQADGVKKVEAVARYAVAELRKI
jgi:beta-lactamase class A